jgi:phospholipid/cholesterol/gamma-HCH transport system substrate-binding protein
MFRREIPGRKKNTMKKIFSREVKIALTAIAAIVLLFFGLNFLKGMSLFDNNVEYKMMFTDLKGLMRNTSIYANGYKVGTVKDILYDFEKQGPIEVDCEIDPRLYIPYGTKAKIETDLMGNIKVSLLLGKQGAQRLKPGDVIEGVDDKGAMSQVAEMMPDIQAIIPKVDSIMSNLNMILSNPALVSILTNMDGMSANLKETTQELNGLLKEIHQGVPGMMRHADKTLANTEKLTNNLSKIDVDGMMAKIDHTLNNVESMTNALNSKEGTLGLLMHDKTAYNNLSSTLSHVDSLMIDLKAHPKRYVHFSIFGRKDK